MNNNNKRKKELLTLNKDTIFKYWKHWSEKDDSRWEALNYLFTEYIKEDQILEEALNHLGYVGACLDIKEVGRRMNSVVNRDTWSWAKNFLDAESKKLKNLDFAEVIERIEEYLAREQAWGIMVEIREQFASLEHYLE